jgi:hypothetical protein
VGGWDVVYVDANVVEHHNGIKERATERATFGDGQRE